MGRRLLLFTIVLLLSLVALTTQQQVGSDNEDDNNNIGQPDGDMNNDGRFNFSNTQDGRPNFNPGRGRFRNNDTNTTMAPILLGVGGGLLFLSLCLLSARLWSRLRPVMRLHIDDWTVLVATILSITNYAFLSASVVHGLGRRSRFVASRRRRIALELLFISQVIWYWSITLTKLSVAFLMFRIKRSDRRWRIFLYSVMLLLVLAALVQTAFQFTQCRPFSVFWDPRVYSTGRVKCFRRSVINGNIVAFSSVQVCVDLVFSAIPITFIRKLNRPLREKVFMCVLMALGIFASCAAIVRTLKLQGFYTSRDIFRTSVDISLWAIVEQQFALIAATIPTLKAFLEKALIRIGLFFYDETTETEVRDRLVQFGLLGKDEKLEKAEQPVRRPSTLNSPIRMEKKLKDEYGDTVMDTQNDKEVEDMLSKSAV